MSYYLLCIELTVSPCSERPMMVFSLGGQYLPPLTAANLQSVYDSLFVMSRGGNVMMYAHLATIEKKLRLNNPQGGKTDEMQ